MYGCEPGMKVKADSCLIRSFLKRVDKSKLDNDSIVLPGKILNFKTSNGGESTCKYDKPLHFYGPRPKTKDVKLKTTYGKWAFLIIAAYILITSLLIDEKIAINFDLAKKQEKLAKVKIELNDLIEIEQEKLQEEKLKYDEEYV